MPISLLDLPLRSPRSQENCRKAMRAYERFRVHVDGETHAWEGLNLSEGGMLCTAPAPVWPGTAIAVTLNLPKHPPINVHAHVAELVPYGHTVAMRLKFLALSETHRQALASILRELS